MEAELHASADSQDNNEEAPDTKKILTKKQLAKLKYRKNLKNKKMNAKSAGLYKNKANDAKQPIQNAEEIESNKRIASFLIAFEIACETGKKLNDS